MPKFLKAAYPALPAATSTSTSATDTASTSTRKGKKDSEVHPLTLLSAQQWRDMKALPLSPYLLTCSYATSTTSTSTSAVDVVGMSSNFTEVEVLAAGLAVNVSSDTSTSTSTAANSAIVNAQQQGGRLEVYDRFRLATL